VEEAYHKFLLFTGRAFPLEGIVRKVSHNVFIYALVFSKINEDN